MFMHFIIKRPNSSVKTSIALVWMLIFIANSSFGQSPYLPMNSREALWLQKLEIKTGGFASNVHTGESMIPEDAILPIIRSYQQKDTLEGDRENTVLNHNIQWMIDRHAEYAPEDARIEGRYPLFWGNIFDKKTDFYFLNTADAKVRLNPVVFYQGGGNSIDPHYKVWNVRGFEVRGSLFNKLGFYTYLGENQWAPQDYVFNYMNRYGAVPSQGYFKIFNHLNKANKYYGYDFLDARGYITFSTLKNCVRFTFGQDRQQIGYGMRSLWLSDNSASIPFLRVNSHYGKFDYENLFMQLTMQTTFNKGDFLFPKKFAAFHHFTYNPFKRLKIGLFEGVVFQRNQQFELAYLNPVITYRFVEHSLGSPDNTSLGIDGAWIIGKSLKLYGQAFLDEFNFNRLKANFYNWTNKYGMQLGFQYDDMFGVQNLDATMEANWVRPYTYAHHDSIANFTHYNQPLAHPLGANFQELTGRIVYQPNSRLTASVHGAYQIYGADTANSNWGGNPLSSYQTRPSRLAGTDITYAYPTTIGNKTNTLILDYVLSYELAYNLFLELNYIHRSSFSQTAPNKQYEDFYGIGVRYNYNRSHQLY